MRYIAETTYSVLDDQSGRTVTIGPDSDGLGLIQIKDSENNNYMLLEPEEARLIADALYRAVADASSAKINSKTIDKLS